MQGSDLSKAELQEANSSETQLQGANLREAHLQGAKLSKTQLQGANLWKIQMQGSDLSKAELQEANLSKAQLQGVYSESNHDTFEKRIKERVGKDSHLKFVTFSGGLSSGKVEEIINSMPDNMPHPRKQKLAENLKQQIDKPTSHDLPDDSEAIVDQYSEEQAEQWIAEYKKAVGIEEKNQKAPNNP